MNTTIQAIRGYRRETPGKTLTAVARDAYDVLVLWRERARQRKRLARLTIDELADIGIGAQAARREAAKPFWSA